MARLVMQSIHSPGRIEYPGPDSRRLSANEHILSSPDRRSISPLAVAGDPTWLRRLVDLYRDKQCARSAGLQRKITFGMRRTRGPKTSLIYHRRNETILEASPEPIIICSESAIFMNGLI
ncbi:uncharacterized protein LOC110117318 isoform X1 [Athalia rosae]|uniref:uncharacterized protein LOC110117318 isoform X1 n=1 Tax=Athalia rosae TaxID=37344 RepID=UPI002033AABC|nr:uncharacterized protein LOC110117318 isoform X1 [Athalia rosae]